MCSWQGQSVISGHQMQQEVEEELVEEVVCVCMCVHVCVCMRACECVLKLFQDILFTFFMFYEEKFYVVLKAFNN